MNKYILLTVPCRPGSPMRRSRRTCRTLQEPKNRTRRKTTGTPARTEVGKALCCSAPRGNHCAQTHTPCWSSAVKSSVSMDLSDQKKTRMKLKKFLTRRPTYQAVRDKGYIKGRELLLRWFREGGRGVGGGLVLPVTSRWRCKQSQLLLRRSGVWLQSHRPVPAGGHVGA